MANFNSSVVNGSLQADQLIVASGDTSSAALYVSGNAHIQGDLEVQGDLVYVGTKDLRVEDKVIEIAYSTGSLTTASVDGAGIVVGNESSPIVSAKYSAAEDKIVVNKQIKGTVDSASVANTASVALKTHGELRFGAGISVNVSGSPAFDGSQTLEIALAASGAKITAAEHADSASKLDRSLTITGDGLAEPVIFNGYEEKTASIDLSAYEKKADFEAYTASAVQEHANILASASAAQKAADDVYASASAWHSADSASAAAAQDTANSASTLVTEVKNTYVTTASYNSFTQSYNSFTQSYNSYSQSVSSSITNIEQQIGESGSVQEKIDAAINKLTVANTGSAGYHVVSIAQSSGSISAAVAKDDEYTIKKEETAETGYLATYKLYKNDTAVGASINLAKDLVIESGEVKTCTVADDPVVGYKVGDKYLDLVITNSDKHIYILVSDLVDKFDGASVVLSDAYAKASVYSEPAAKDTMNAAIGKLAKGVEVARSESAASASEVKNYVTSSVNWVSANGSNVVASASVATAAKSEADALVSKSGSWDSAKDLVNASASAWNAAEKNAKDAASASLAEYSASQAQVNANLSASIAAATASSDNVYASASAWHTADSNSAAAAKVAADNAYASASAWHTADSASAATNAAAIKTLVDATASYMKTDASNSNIGTAGISFSNGAATIKYNATDQSFEFIFA